MTVVQSGFHESQVPLRLEAPALAEASVLRGQEFFIGTLDHFHVSYV